jgi:hypothetical protein
VVPTQKLNTSLLNCARMPTQATIEGPDPYPSRV